MILSLHNIVAGYGGSDVLKGVNLEIETGSITCIVGPNGAGKSTVLRVVSGLLKPRIGEITYNGSLDCRDDAAPDPVPGDRAGASEPQFVPGDFGPRKRPHGSFHPERSGARG